MDPTEDLSARVLLKHILSTDPPVTPITRSDPQAPSSSSSGLRRSSRLSRKTAEARTPQDVLRRNLKRNIHESITRTATARRRTPSVLEKLSSSASFVSNETPRHLLRNILQTEPVKSPVVHEREHSEEPDQHSADQTATKTHSGIELSGLDLPDLTVSNVASIAKGLSRKRPRPTLNVTAFEKLLKRRKDTGEETENSASDLSALSLLSSSSLSLKTPFADVQTEKRGLQRKVSNRRKITAREFEAAVSDQHIGDVSSLRLVEENICEVTDTERFTLGLSKLSVPDLTVDIVHGNTTLYDQPGAGTSKLQTDTKEGEQEEKRCRMERQKSVNVLPRGEVAAAKPQNEERVSDPEPEESAAEAEPRTEEGQYQLDNDAADASVTEEDAAESETNADAQTEEEGAADSHPEETDNLDDLTEKEEVSPDSQRDEEEMVEKEDFAGSQTEESSRSEEEECELKGQTEDVGTVALSEGEAEAGSEEEDVSPDSQTEEGDTDTQPEEEEEERIDEIEETAGNSQSEDCEESSQAEEEEDAMGSKSEGVKESASFQDEVEAGSEEEEVPPNSQTEEEDAADSQTDEAAAVSSSREDAEAASQSKQEVEDVAESQMEEEEEEEGEEEEDVMGSKSERVKDSALFQYEVETGSEEEEVPPNSQTEEEDAADSQTDEAAAVSSSQDDAEAASQSKQEGEDVAESQMEEEQLEGGLEVISRKAHRSEGALILPIMEARNDLEDGTAAGLPDGKSKMYSTFNLNTSAELGIGETSHLQIRKSDMAEVSVRDQERVSCGENRSRTETENLFQPHGLTLDAEVGERESVASLEDTQNSAEQEEEWDDEEEDVVQCKTPEFVKKKRIFFRSDSPASSSVLNTQASLESKALPAAKPKQVRRRKSGTARKQAALPKTYLMTAFRHFAKTKVSADVYPVLNEITDKFLVRLAEDLETYAAHAKRKTIEVEDALLLLKRQGYVNDKVPVEVLIEKYLRMEQRKLLIPIATRGNVVIPNKGL